MLYLATLYAFTGKEFVTGWLSLMTAVMTFGCLNLCCLGVIGEYLGRIYEQVKGRPLYLVRDSVGWEAALPAAAPGHAAEPPKRSAA